MDLSVKKRTIIAFFIIVFPLIPLMPGLINQELGFYFDWWPNFWHIEYFSKHFESHHSMPQVIHTWAIPSPLDHRGGIGRPDTLFYGYLLYPLLGFFSYLVGTNLSLRLAIIGLWFLQFISLEKVFFNRTKNKVISYSISALFLWSIYPLTNLYNRSALPELIATGLLICAICFFLLFLWTNDKYKKVQNVLVFGLLLTLCIGTHPITALFGCTVVLLIVIFHSREFIISDSIPILSFMITMIICFICVSPWVYVVLSYSSDLAISSSPGVSIYTDNIDWSISRFLPFPFDKRSLIHGWQVPGLTPWLEAQVNLPLLILLVFNLYRIRERILRLKVHDKIYLIYPLILFIVTTSMSLSPWIWEFLPTLYKNIQMSYRMVTYQNISLVLGLVSVFSVQKNIGFKKTNILSKKYLVIITLCLSIGSVAALEKLMHGMAIMGDIPWKSYDGTWKGNDNKVLLSYKPDVPGSSYVVRSIRESDKEDFIDISFFPDPFKIEDTTNKEVLFETRDSVWVKTNILAFPWNKISVNSELMSEKDYYRSNSRSHGEIVFPLFPGEYILSYKYVPERFYTILRSISLTVTSIYIMIIALFPIGMFFRKHRFQQR